MTTTNETNKAIGKAWNVVAYTFHGEFYCTEKSCQPEVKYAQDGRDMPQPVFSSDWAYGEVEGCANCGVAIR